MAYAHYAAELWKVTKLAVGMNYVMQKKISKSLAFRKKKEK